MDKREVKRIRVTNLRKESFYLYGIVTAIAKTGESIKVTKGDSVSTFWIKVPKYLEGTFSIGDKRVFVIQFSTYEGRDGMLRTAMNVTTSDILENEDDLKKGFVEGHMAVDIQSSVRTGVPNIFLLTMKRMLDGDEIETYHMRYYSKDDHHPDIGKAIIKFGIYNTKHQLSINGEVFKEIETRGYTVDGEEVTAESLLYYPCLSIREIIR